MKDNRMTIVIDKPIQEVFDFSLNPENTPKWIPDIAVEETSEWPVKVGTIYRNKRARGAWNTYELVEIVPGSTFTLKSKDTDFSVRYTFKELPDHKTEFEYYEWVESGTIDPFTFEHLEKFRDLVEN